MMMMMMMMMMLNSSNYPSSLFYSIHHPFGWPSSFTILFVWPSSFTIPLYGTILYHQPSSWLAFCLSWVGRVRYHILSSEVWMAIVWIEWNHCQHNHCCDPTIVNIDASSQCWSRAWVCVWVLRRRRTDSMPPSIRRPSRLKVMSCNRHFYVELYCKSTTWLSMWSSILTTIPIPAFTIYHGYHLFVFYRRHFDQKTKPF